MQETIGAVLHQVGGRLDIQKVLVDDPQDNEILVRVISSGICHTDITFMGYGPFIPGVYGHEGGCVVEKVGANVTKVKPGDHVVMCMVAPCGSCPECLKGRRMYCTNYNMFAPISRADGTYSIKDVSGNGIIHGPAASFSGYTITAENSVIKIDNDMPLEIAGIFACGVQTGAGAVMNSLDVKLGSSIAVFGIGTVGLSAIMAARIRSCKFIIAVDVNSERLELAKELGATHIVNGKEEDALARIREITGGGADYSIDTVGNSKVTRQVIECTKPTSGITGLIGAQDLAGEVTIGLLTLLTGRKVQGITEGDAIPELFIPQLVDLYFAGKLPVDRLITNYKFEQINQAIEDFEKGKVIKPVVLF